MAPTSTQTITGNPDSGRRQPARRVRANAVRPVNYYARPFAGRRPTVEASNSNDKPPGFFPAITYFTDSISALPKEVTRHITMLKEVEAKTFGPDEQQAQLCSMIAALPPPKRRRTDAIGSANFDATAEAVANGTSAQPGPEDVAGAHLTEMAEDQVDQRRLQLFFQLAMVTRQSLMALDEKIAVINTANDTLSKQLARLDSCWPYVQEEISEEARFGSTTHWAYKEKEGKKTGNTMAGERARRDIAATNNLAAAAAAIYESEIATTRSEARREALMTRKGRVLPVESDFDDRPQKKANSNPKARKVVEPAASGDRKAMSLALSNNVPGAQLPRKRKVDRGAPTAQPMERSASASVSNLTRVAQVSREATSTEGSKRKAKSTLAGSPAKKRNATGPLARPSPHPTSSPNLGAAGSSRKFSPSAHRPFLSRARQNSTQSLPQARILHRTPSTSSIKPNNSAAHSVLNLGVMPNDAVVGAPEDNPPPPAEPKANVNEIDSIEQEDTSPASLVNAESRNGNDDSINGEDVQYFEDSGQQAAEIPATRSGRASKTATPVLAAAPAAEPMSRSRSTRSTQNNPSAGPILPMPPNSQVPKRSHKKGQGLAAQAAAAATPPVVGNTPTAPSPINPLAVEPAASTEVPDLIPDKGSPTEDTFPSAPFDVPDVLPRLIDEEPAMLPHPGEEEDANTEGEGDGRNEPRYCYCNDVSYGQMVACDGDGCEREWFHLSCAGLKTAPRSNAKWYCDDCKERLKRGRPGTAGRVQL